MSVVIICDKPGRLGNLLIIFTHFAALALERDIQILNPSFAHYKHYFKGTSNQRIPHYNVKSTLANAYLPFAFASTTFKIFRRLSTPLPHIIRHISLDSNDYLDLDLPINQKIFDSRITLIGGWLYRCDVLVQKHKLILRDFFQPLDIYRDEAIRITLRARQCCAAKTLIGIHIRLGDYREFQNGKYFYPLSFYRSLIQSLTDQYPFPLAFIIVSDQPLTSQDFLGHNVYISHSSEIVDMSILSLCDGVIGPPSTFSFYACNFIGNENLLHLEKKLIEIPKSFIDALNSQDLQKEQDSNET
jgi:hypothetical protein